ncbi:MAG: prephenate dehydrogenase, partial [Frankiales bacterium]|nr:prephenate dehydrogenase [Frankiales bacterium]
PLLRATAADLLRAADDLDAAGDLAVTVDLLRRGNLGRSLVPVKRGQHDRDLVAVRVELPDTPGRLVAVLQVAAGAGVNVEDVRLDHVPGRPQGTVELLVAGASQERLAAALREAGLDGHPAR